MRSRRRPLDSKIHCFGGKKFEGEWRKRIFLFKSSTFSSRQCFLTAHCWHHNFLQLYPDWLDSLKFESGFIYVDIFICTNSTSTLDSMYHGHFTITTRIHISFANNFMNKNAHYIFRKINLSGFQNGNHHILSTKINLNYFLEYYPQCFS